MTSRCEGSVTCGLHLRLDRSRGGGLTYRGEGLGVADGEEETLLEVHGDT